MNKRGPCISLKCVAIERDILGSHLASITFEPGDTKMQSGGQGQFALPVSNLGFLDGFEVRKLYVFDVDLDLTRHEWRAEELRQGKVTTCG